ncbi:MAG: M48 family metallopeptidase [Pseudomonadota bacterium]
MGAFGLQTQIWNNNLKSIVLLALFPVLLLVLLYGVSVGYVALTEPVASTVDGLERALDVLLDVWPAAFIAAAVWFAIAWASHSFMIRKTAGAQSLSRKQAPEIYNILENLCISQGVPMPALNVINSGALNAFASGIDKDSYTITLTQGIIDQLNRDELEAVIAHELTHIQNRDVRLLIISVIFVGIFSFVGELLFRGVFRTGVRIGGHTRSRNGDSRGGGALILVAVALIAVSYILGMVVRFALSQKREFLADAGAVDLTRNPDAMISALQKISGNADMDVSVDVRQMMIENANPFAGIFMTHPSIDKRINALRMMGGAG